MTLDKSRLEKDIEQQEESRKPRGMFLIVALLAIAFGAVGAYTLQLKQKLQDENKEKISVEQNCAKEKAVLLDKIKKLQQKLPDAGPQ